MKYEGDFISYRKWFNKMFSLSLDGKFKSLSALAEIIDIEWFAYKLYKILSGRYRKLYGDVITIHVSGHRIKLYNR